MPEDPARSGALVLRPGDARAIPLGGFDVLVHADGRATDDAFSLIETIESVAGLGPPLHLHRDCAESFYVVAGGYRMHIDGHDYECPAGTFVYPKDDDRPLVLLAGGVGITPLISLMTGASSALSRWRSVRRWW